MMSSPQRTAAIQGLMDLLCPLLPEDPIQPALPQTLQTDTDYQQILTALQGVVRTLIPEKPLFAIFHDGQVHNPLGGGAYAFRNSIVEPVLRGLVEDEDASASEPPAEVGNPNRLPTRPVVIHAGLQPNNSPHVGTLVVFALAFAFARALRDHMQTVAAAAAGEGDKRPPPPVTVLITFVDTAPVADRGVQREGVQYQRSYRDDPAALATHMADYDEVLGYLSAWSGIPLTIAFQRDLFAGEAVPALLGYMISRRATLGPQLALKYGSLAIRAACPEPGCGLVEKYGLLNEYEEAGDLSCHSHEHDKIPNGSGGGGSGGGAITFHCPDHGPHTVHLNRPEEIVRLEANAPTRNLLRSMTHLVDDTAHHIRVTGSDYAGMYQEEFLYRPLAAWWSSSSSSSSSSGTCGRAGGRTPRILYAPLIVDWSGAKLSKSLYVRAGGYESLGLLGMDGLCSYAQMRRASGRGGDGHDDDDDGGGGGAPGLRRLWDEVRRWVAEPKNLFRTFSLAYLQDVIDGGQSGFTVQ